MNTALHLATDPGRPFAWSVQRIARALSGTVYAPCAPAAAVTASLAQDEFRSLGSSIGVTVECVAGALWVTQDGDCRDVILAAGQSHVADRTGRLIVHAFEPSRVRFHGA